MTEDTKETIKIVGGLLGILCGLAALVVWIGWMGHSVGKHRAEDECEKRCACRAEYQVLALPTGDAKQIVIYPMAREKPPEVP